MANLQAGGAAFLVSLILCLTILATRRWHRRWSNDGTAGIQKLHATPVPRIGGLAILGGLAVGATLAPPDLRLFLLAALPAFAAGLAEDLTKRVSVRLRLAATLVSGAAFCLLTGNMIDLPGLPPLFLFTSFAIAGIANAMNIIDGGNGVSSGTAVIVLCGLAVVAVGAGDGPALAVALTVLGAVLGFFVLNFPFGRLFLGDGGAYLIGVLLAGLAVAIPARNPEVSPFFGLLILAYPVVETLITVARRAARRQGNAMLADRLHLHSLFHRRRARVWARRIGRPGLAPLPTALAMWALSLIAGFLAVVWHEEDALLLFGLLPVTVAYLAIYRQVALIGAGKRAARRQRALYRPMTRFRRASP